MLIIFFYSLFHKSLFFKRNIYYQAVVIIILVMKSSSFFHIFLFNVVFKVCFHISICEWRLSRKPFKDLWEGGCIGYFLIGYFLNQPQHPNHHSDSKMCCVAFIFCILFTNLNAVVSKSVEWNWKLIPQGCLACTPLTLTKDKCLPGIFF